MWGRGLEKNEVEITRDAQFRKAEFLVVNDACKEAIPYLDLLQTKFQMSRVIRRHKQSLIITDLQ